MFFIVKERHFLNQRKYKRFFLFFKNIIYLLKKILLISLQENNEVSFNKVRFT